MSSLRPLFSAKDFQTFIHFLVVLTVFLLTTFGIGCRGKKVHRPFVIKITCEEAEAFDRISQAVLLSV